MFDDEREAIFEALIPWYSKPLQDIVFLLSEKKASFFVAWVTSYTFILRILSCKI